MSLTEPVRRRDGSSRSWTHDALVNLPARTTSPAVELLRRGLLALLLLLMVVLIVWVDRDAYTDNYDGRVGLIDAIYYATVTITTTGYGDITPVAPHARVISAIIVTPLRIAFLVLVGRNHSRGAGAPGPSRLQRHTLEETDAQSRRGRGLWHQGS